MNRFSIRELFLLTALAAVVLGWMHDRRQTEQARKILKDNAWFISTENVPHFWEVSVVIRNDQELAVMRKWIDE